MLRARALILATLAASAGCSRTNDNRDASEVASPATSTPPPMRIASCDRVTAMSYCAERMGSDLAESELPFRGACAKLGGSFALAECPNTSVLGSCRLPTGEIRKLYASGANAFDPARAKDECERAYHGTWRVP